MESAHFGWQGEHSVDGSVRAHAGYQPAFTILNATTEADPKGAYVAVLQPALTFSAGGRIGFPVQKNSSELSAVANFGATRPTTDAVTFDDKKPPLNATQVAPDSSLTSTFVEIGADYAMFDNPIRVLHAEKGLLTPAIALGMGYRYDSRFRQDNLSSIPDFSSSPHRLYARFMVDAIKSVTTRAAGGDAEA